MSGSKDVFKDVFKDGDKKWKTSGFDPQTSGVQTLNPTQTCHIKPPPLGTLPPPLLERLNIKKWGEKGEEGEGSPKEHLIATTAILLWKHMNYPWGDLTNSYFQSVDHQPPTDPEVYKQTLRLRTYNRVQGTDLWFSDNSIAEAKLFVYQRIPFQFFSVICIFLYILFV